MAIDRNRRSQGGYVPLRTAIDQLFEGSFLNPQMFGTQAGFPQTDVHVSENDVTVEMAVPGANPNDINIQVTGDTVTISGEVKGHQEGQKGQTYVQEIWQGRFQRSFTLPVEVDANKAEANYENGILTLTLPKSESTKPRKIQVKSQHTVQGQTVGGTQQETVPVQGGASS